MPFFIDVVQSRPPVFNFPMLLIIKNILFITAIIFYAAIKYARLICIMQNNSHHHFSCLTAFVFSGKLQNGNMANSKQKLAA